MRDTAEIRQLLQKLGLSDSEAAIFIALLDSPKSPLQVSRITGIARSNVYRIVDGMIERGLVHERTSADGKALVSAEPEALELLVIEQENLARSQRSDIDRLLPMMHDVIANEEEFAIHVYRGLNGMKQMLWTELKYPGEVLVFSSFGSLNEATGKRWAEKFRSEVIARKITQRSLQNFKTIYTDQKDYFDHYLPRYIPARTLDIQPEIAVHEDTIFIYNPFDNEVRLGTEIKNRYLAAFLRDVFEHYWEIAGDISDTDAPPVPSGDR